MDANPPPHGLQFLEAMTSIHPDARGGLAITALMPTSHAVCEVWCQKQPVRLPT